MMPQFRMQGKPITGYSMFLKYFSPEDILRQRELAAGFIYQHLMLSPTNEFHCKVFYSAALHIGEWIVDLPTWGSYYELECGNPYECDPLKQNLIAAEMEKQKKTHGKLVERIWELSHDNSLPNEDQEQMFCMLTASYCLAEADINAELISAEAAVKAYKREPEKLEKEDKWVSFEGDGDITLTARNTPYCILLGTNPGELLNNERAISFRKIVAVDHPQHPANMMVILEIYRSETDEKPEQVEEMKPDDYRYINCIGNVPVYVHPAERKVQSCRLKREGNVYTYCHGDKRDEPKSRTDGVDLVGFAVSPRAGDYLLLYRDGTYSDSHYSFEKPWHRENVVQVEFQEQDEYLTLDNKGNVYSSLNDSEPRAVGVAVLEEYTES